MIRMSAGMARTFSKLPVPVAGEAEREYLEIVRIELQNMRMAYDALGSNGALERSVRELLDATTLLIDKLLGHIPQRPEEARILEAANNVPTKVTF